VQPFSLLNLQLHYIYTIHYCIKLYTNIHTFTYTNILCNIHNYYIIALQYIKELQYNNVFNIRKKALNHRMCYTGYIIILHYYLNNLNT
jgi:hypothetical protein